MVLAQPLIARLAATSPGGVDVLAPPWVLPLVHRMPGVARAIESPFRHRELAAGARWRLARELARGHYDQAVVLPNSAKSALVPWWAGIPRRTGFRGEFRFGLLNDLRRFDPEQFPRLVDRFLLLGDAAPGPAPAPVPVLVSAPAQQEAVRRRLGLAPSGPVACLCPGAEYGPAKRWPAEHFAALAAALRARGFEVWLLGSPQDRAVAADIGARAPDIVTDLTGRTSLDEATDLLAQVSLVVSNDSGLMHVAAALGRRVLALFGSSSEAYTPPLSPHARIVRHPVSCSPCFARECPLGHFECLRGLAPAQVLAALDAMETDT